MSAAAIIREDREMHFPISGHAWILKGFPQQSSQKNKSLELEIKSDVYSPKSLAFF
jgi:hypothetical protein